MAGYAEDLRRIPMSQGLGATLARAAEYAQAQAHGEVALEHLLLALTEDDDAAQVLSASHVNTLLLKSDVSHFLGGLDVRHDGGDPGKISLAVDLKRILEAAAAAASQGRRREINGAIVLAAIVGDGRSSAAHMLRAQGLTFEEAIKALQRALAPPAAMAPPAAIPSAKPDAEDILATARARVQTRAAPGLPPAPPRPEPAPPVVVSPPNTEILVEDRKTPAVVVPSLTESTPWPPEVRRFEPPAEFEETGLGDDRVRRGHEPDVPQLHAQAEAAAYEFEPEPGAAPQADFAEPGGYAYPPLPPALPSETPSSAGPRVATPHGSRWPAPVAPAWRDQSAQPGGHDGRPIAPPSLPSSMPPGSPAADFGTPPPLPEAPPPAYASPVQGEWSDDGAHAWPETHDTSGPYRGESLERRDAAPAYGQDPFERGYSQAPPAPLPWPQDTPVPHASAGPGESYGGTEPEAYHPDWPHQDGPSPEWAEPPTREMPAYHGGGPDGIVPVPSGRPESAGGDNPVPKGSRRRKADRAAAGLMGDSIPRRMRAHVASAVDVQLGRAEMTSLLEGLSDDGGRAVALGSLSVKLRAPEGRFMIESTSVETQWLQGDGGALDGAGGSWRWTVTPLKPGRRRLQLAVWARTVSPGGMAVVTPLPDQTIEVRVGRNFGRSFGRLLGWAMFAGMGWLAATYGSAVTGPVMAELLKLMK